MNYPQPITRITRCCLASAALFLTLCTASALLPPEGEQPAEFDVRGPKGVPTGTALRQPTAAQLKAIASLEASAGGPLTIQYNGLTATPRHMLSHSGPLSERSSASPEGIARDFLSRWRAIWRLSEDDLNHLRLRSRATLPDTGTTILAFEQHVEGVSVYKGEVLVNVNGAGQIISVGNENYPEMSVTNAFTLSPAAAVTAAAAQLGAAGFAPQSLGTTNVLRTYGDLPHEFTEGARFDGGETFTDEIVVTRVIFPLGEQARAAYQFTLTTPQYHGISWENIVDAQSGEVLRRISLTAFQAGGGIGAGRYGTMRPDVQNMLEGLNSAGTAAGKVFDALPTALSGRSGFGRSTAPGDPPDYAPDTAATAATGRGFRQGLVFGRNESSLIYSAPFGQVPRGFADALNPTPESPFGWFYLPTDDGGTSIGNAEGNANRASTRAHGYKMQNAAQARNLAENSPEGDGDQPFSATVTALSAPLSLADGRTLPAVIQSNYTEGNNVMVAEDHANDNDITHGIKGFHPDRLFTAAYFTFVNGYEYGGKDPTGVAPALVFPASTFPDIYPGTVNLFYVINFLHDYLYGIGFTEPLWNFQQDNFGKGGAAADAVSAHVQDGSGTNNANFSTPADGTRSRMQMYLFTEASVRRSDGDFDFDVIAHELYHGVSNRSAGKGQTGCLTNIQGGGESGGQGEGWSDYIAESMSDDDTTGDYVVGHFDSGIRRLPKTNFRWSYESINQKGLTRRDRQAVDPDTTTGLPFAVHRTGEVWAASLWDMRELLIMKDPAGVFFDGDRRLGDGTKFFIGSRQVSSVDTAHPIDYRASFSTNDPATIKPAEHIVRPGRVAAEIAAQGNRNGPLATALSKGARLADTLVLRGLQLCPCNPSFVDSRDSILLADRELTGGENQAIIWRAFASHGIGLLARSTGGSADDAFTNAAPVVVEDFTVPTGVTQCEAMGPLPAPDFTLSTPADNKVTLTIPVVSGGHTKVISRSANANGPFAKIAEIPNATTTYDDTPLPGGDDFFYQVRITREDTTIPAAPMPNPNCVSTANTNSVTVTGPAIFPPPAFAGVDRVDDPRDGSRLIVSWLPATSLDPAANLVYDIYRVEHVEHGNGVNDPAFTPSAANRIALGVTGTSYADTGKALNQVYYYIVQARDSISGRKDNETGNSLVKWNAPTIPCVLSPAPFALETFEAATASNRFAPPLAEAEANPNQAAAAFQRITLAGLGHPSAGEMYAPNFSPGHEANACNPNPQNTGCGGASDFFTQMGPFNGPGNPALTATSIMEFDQTIATEDRFDGGVIEVKVGSAFVEGDATPFPNNVNVFDLGDYMIDGGYNSKLDGRLQNASFGSVLQGRRAFSGVKGLHHARISLRSFAPGGLHNPNGLPVFIRFRETSDAATAIGVNAGWFIDNLVINNMGGSGTVPLQEVVSRKTHGNSATFEVPLPLTGPTGVEPRTGGATGDHTVVFKFGAPLTTVGGASVTGGGSVTGHGYDETTQEYVVDLTGVPNAREVTVTLTGVNDACGNTAPSIAVPMGVLLGDTTGDRSTDSGDISQTKRRSGQALSTGNFRSDVTADGSLDSGDISVVKSKSGTALPAQ